jgi:hypothetical protein
LRVPVQALAKEDYLLNWIVASLHEAANPAFTRPYDLLPEFIWEHQEDVDLLIGFDEGSITYLVHREMKGVGSWSNDQLDSKVRRLANLYGVDGKRWPGVRPFLVLGSPNPPQRLRTAQWPGWTKAMDGTPLWLALLPPPPTFASGRSRVHRSDAKGKRGIGGWWTTTPLRHFPAG